MLTRTSSQKYGETRRVDKTGRTYRKRRARCRPRNRRNFWASQEQKYERDNGSTTHKLKNNNQILHLSVILCNNNSDTYFSTAALTPLARCCPRNRRNFWASLEQKYGRDNDNTTHELKHNNQLLNVSVILCNNNSDTHFSTAALAPLVYQPFLLFIWIFVNCDGTCHPTCEMKSLIYVRTVPSQVDRYLSYN